jgi:hypothetical protein
MRGAAWVRAVMASTLVWVCLGQVAAGDCSDGLERDIEEFASVHALSYDGVEPAGYWMVRAIRWINARMEEAARLRGRVDRSSCRDASALGAHRARIFAAVAVSHREVADECPSARHECARVVAGMRSYQAGYECYALNAWDPSAPEPAWLAHLHERRAECVGVVHPAYRPSGEPRVGSQPTEAD